jgi:hypothetical protein
MQCADTDANGSYVYKSPACRPRISVVHVGALTAMGMATWKFPGELRAASLFLARTVHQCEMMLQC